MKIQYDKLKIEFDIVKNNKIRQDKINSKNEIIYNQLEDFKREHIEIINEKDE